MIAGRRVREALRAAGDHPLLLSADGQARTGNELFDRTHRLAGALAGSRLNGRRIGLWYQNGFAAFEAFLAVELLGATRVPVDPSAPAAEAHAVFEAGGVDAVLADASHATELGADALVHDDDQPLRGPWWSDEVGVYPETPLIVYPRAAHHGELFGVATSYGNWDAIMTINETLYRDGWYGPGFDDTECFLTVQQLMHGTGMLGSFPFLRMGLPQVVLSHFEAGAVLEALQRHQVTATFAVPGMLTRLTEALDNSVQREPLPLRHTLYGGAPVPVEDLRWLRHELGPSLVQLYGRFEAGWPLTVLSTEDHAQILNGNERIATSCGRPAAGVDISLRPIPGRTNTDGRGELVTRSGMVSPDFCDPEGWCSLGDLASIDENDYVHLAGRLDGMINTGSYHVYPNEVEQALLELPQVTATKVRGEPDPRWGQAVTAYVTTNTKPPESDLTDTVREKLGHRLAKYKLPKTVHIVESLPN